MNNRTLTGQEKSKIIQDLLQRRSAFLSIKSKVTELVEPRIFSLLQENVSNVRNGMVISGALTTIGLVVLNQLSNSLSPESQILLKISVISFLSSILTFSYWLKNTVGSGLASYKKKIDEAVVTAEKGESIINDCLDGKITKDEADKKLLEVSKEIEFQHIRTRPKVADSSNNWQKWLAIIGNTFFVIAIGSLMVSLIASLFLLRT